MGRQVNLTDKSNRLRSFAIYAGKKTHAKFLPKHDTAQHCSLILNSCLLGCVQHARSLYYVVSVQQYPGAMTNLIGPLLAITFSNNTFRTENIIYLLVI